MKFRKSYSISDIAIQVYYITNYARMQVRLPIHRKAAFHIIFYNWKTLPGARSFLLPTAVQRQHFIVCRRHIEHKTHQLADIDRFFRAVFECDTSGDHIASLKNRITQSKRDMLRNSFGYYRKCCICYHLIILFF